MMTEEQAQKRLDSQISNSVRLSKSNVVFCTLWEYEYTQMQVSWVTSLGPYAGAFSDLHTNWYNPKF